MITKFKRYLQRRDESAYEFAERSKIAIHTVYKMIRGEPVRKDTVKKAIRYAKGKLEESDFNIKSNLS
jgi:predicted transcriptional regulator